MGEEVKQNKTMVIEDIQLLPHSFAKDAQFPFVRNTLPIH